MPFPKRLKISGRINQARDDDRVFAEAVNDVHRLLRGRLWTSLLPQYEVSICRSWRNLSEARDNRTLSTPFAYVSLKFPLVISCIVERAILDNLSCTPSKTTPL